MDKGKSTSKEFKVMFVTFECTEVKASFLTRKLYLMSSIKYCSKKLLIRKQKNSCFKSYFFTFILEPATGAREKIRAVQNRLLSIL